MDSDCVFCKIISGDIPSFKIYEDDSTFAFLDIAPIHPGHSLVIPKKHTPFFHQLENKDYLALMNTSKKIGEAINRAFSPERVGIIIEGFDVNHTHVKVTPLYGPKDILTTHIEKPSEEEFQNTLEKLSNSIDNK